MSLTQDFELARNVLNGLLPTDAIFFTLRHGESSGQRNINDYKTIGDTNLPLTPLGIRQSIAAGHVLDDIAHDAELSPIRLVTSTGLRSGRTALEIYNVMKNSHDIRLIEDERLDKQKFGLFDGLFTRAERQQTHPDLYKMYAAQVASNGEFYARPPEGESIADVQARIQDLIFDLLKNPVPTIMVTHGTNTLCIENILMKRGEDWVLKGIDTRPNASIQLLTGNRAEGFSARIVSVNPIQWQKSPDHTQRAPS